MHGYLPGDGLPLPVYCRSAIHTAVQIAPQSRVQDAAASYNNIQVQTVQDWWDRHISGPRKDAQQAIMYLAWNIWNERNHRIFEPLMFLQPLMMLPL